MTKSGMAMEPKYGQMVPNMKAIGSITRPKARVSSGMQKAMSTRVISRMIKQTAMEYIPM